MNSVNGQPFIIARAGALDNPVGGEIRRPGFLEGQIQVPDDFDRMGSAEIEKLFGGEET